MFIIAGCGDGERQEADEPVGTWKVAVEEFDFPATQRLGSHYRLTLRVRNLEETTIPNLTVSFTGLEDLTTQQGAADRKRDRWVRDRPMPGSQTSNRNTYSFGAVEGGEVGEFWMVLTPVRRGRAVVTYTLAGGLGGNAKVTYEDGTPATGQIEVAVDPSIDIEKDTLD